MGWLTLPILRGFAVGYESAHSGRYELGVALCNYGLPNLGWTKACSRALDAVEAEAYKIGSNVGADAADI